MEDQVIDACSFSQAYGEKIVWRLDSNNTSIGSCFSFILFFSRLGKLRCTTEDAYNREMERLNGLRQATVASVASGHRLATTNLGSRTFAQRSCLTLLIHMLVAACPTLCLDDAPLHWLL